jgi:hypothetical protein
MTLAIGFNSTANILALYYDKSCKNNELYSEELEVIAFSAI